MQKFLIRSLFLVLLFSAAESWALPKCKNIFHNCQGTYTDANGNKYVGQWRAHKRHWHGTYTYASGDKYVGGYRDDKKTGHGTFTYTDGDKYVGEWKDDERHGQGTYTSADGDKYVGEWKDGLWHGQGTLTYNSSSVFWAGDKYVGKWRDDERHGQDTYYGPNSEGAGQKYVGEWKNGKREGEHKISYRDGAIAIGSYTAGRRQTLRWIKTPSVAAAEKKKLEEEKRRRTAEAKAAKREEAQLYTDKCVLEMYGDGSEDWSASDAERLCEAVASGQSHTIFVNCMLSKGKNKPYNLLKKVFNVCEQMQKEPTAYERLRYGTPASKYFN